MTVLAYSNALFNHTTCSCTLTAQLVQMFGAVGTHSNCRGGTDFNKEDLHLFCKATITHTNIATALKEIFGSYDLNLVFLDDQTLSLVRLVNMKTISLSYENKTPVW